jgi:hypothetical protein
MARATRLQRLRLLALAVVMPLQFSVSAGARVKGCAVSTIGN